MRVVAGELRGRRLASVAGRGTRPTSERARSGLFDWLGKQVEGARVLDLFAGSGSLGIEALSRGAREAVFVERSRAALAILRLNLEQLGLQGVGRCLPGDVRQVLAGGGSEARSFRSGVRRPALCQRTGIPSWSRRAGRARCSPTPGWLVVERSSAEGGARRLSGLRWVEKRSYGGTGFDLYLKDPGGEVE